MPYKRILTVQDISCLGQCSGTVALTVLSACGLETCIIPSAVLSTHTGGFKGYTFRDLTEDIPAIQKHWLDTGITFDAIYTGYLGNHEQIDDVKSIFSTLLVPDGKIIVDPAMGDNGVLYDGFDMEHVEEMKRLCEGADAILPNVTEACLLTGMPYKERHSAAYVEELMSKLTFLGATHIVVTGVCPNDKETGVAILSDGELTYYMHKLIDRTFMGTGDIYSAAVTGAWVRGRDFRYAARLAADFTIKCIEKTLSDPDHWYGVKFERALPYLVEQLNPKK